MGSLHQCPNVCHVVQRCRLAHPEDRAGRLNGNSFTGAMPPWVGCVDEIQLDWDQFQGKRPETCARVTTPCKPCFFGRKKGGRHPV